MFFIIEGAILIIFSSVNFFESLTPSSSRKANCSLGTNDAVTTKGPK